MVLESLIKPFKPRKQPLEMFFMGMLYSSVALFLANWIFKEQASLIMVFLTVLASVPFIYGSIKQEKDKEIRIRSKKILLKEHSHTIKLFVFLFLGFVVSFVFWYTILPTKVIQSTFKVQSITIHSINMKISGGFTSFKTFTEILTNNLKVLVFCILFAFLYGAGAIFILTWNASVISTAIGNFIRSNLALATQKLGFGKIASYLQVISLGLVRYLFHRT